MSDFSFVALNGVGQLFQKQLILHQAVATEPLAATAYETFARLLAQSHSAFSEELRLDPNQEQPFKVVWQAPLKSGGSAHLWYANQLAGVALFLRGADPSVEKVYIRTAREVLSELSTRAGYTWRDDLGGIFERPLAALFILLPVDQRTYAQLGLVMLSLASAYFNTT